MGRSVSAACRSLIPPLVGALGSGWGNVKTLVALINSVVCHKPAAAVPPTPGLRHVLYCVDVKISAV